ncbi:VOC family protein [Nocardioides sp. LHD-245]|uniref:VOC family protein n=1 Tax=Nocardioides sp. LHD-245 TaxID=3051387 RepID=UPI0027DF58E8|nr:VOC family protein [Nocardioides sp. LHD-245]
MTTTPAAPPVPGTVAWFEIATDDPGSAEKFYGGLFAWSFATDEASEAGGLDYRLVTAPGGGAPSGGIFGTGGQMPGHAVFSILVADVAATCAAAEELGGTVVSKHLDVGPGVPTFAYLRDPAGNQLSIFSPPA